MHKIPVVSHRGYVRWKIGRFQLLPILTLGCGVGFGSGQSSYIRERHKAWSLGRFFVLREPPGTNLARNDWLARHGRGHAVGVHLLVEGFDRLLQVRSMQALLLRDRTVFVRQE